MRAECIEAVTQAALKIGRDLTKNPALKAKYIRDIEDEVVVAYRQLARKNNEQWIGMSQNERLTAAAEYIAANRTRDLEWKKRIIELAAIKELEKNSSIKRQMEEMGITKAQALIRFTNFRADGRGGITSIESRAHAQSEIWTSQLRDLWTMGHANFMNYFIANKEADMNFRKEAYGIDSGDEKAKAGYRTYEVLRKQALKTLNDAGFDIKEIENYRLPQKLDFFQVWKSIKEMGGIDNVAKDMMPHYDPKMAVKADGSPMSPEELHTFIKEGLTSVITDGQHKEIKGSGMMAKRHQQHRQFHWKSADSHKYIMDKYGSGDMVSQILNQFEGMARELTLVEQFGPNARDSFDRTFADAIYEAGVNGNTKDIKELNKLRNVFDHYTGNTSKPITNPELVQFLRGLQGATRSAYLGSNTLAQVGDGATAGATALAMNAPVFDQFKNIARYAVSKQYRQELRSAGYGLASLQQSIAQYADGVASHGFFDKATNALMVANFSNFFTNAVRAAGSDNLAHHWSGLVRDTPSFSALDEKNKAVLKAKGVTEEHWAIWKKALEVDDVLDWRNISAVKDADILNLQKDKKLTKAEIKDAEDMRRDAMIQFTSMVAEEGRMASLQPSEWSRDLLRMGEGTVAGEAWGILTQFKSFPFAYAQQHIIDRGLRGGEGIANRKSYLISLAFMSAIAGAMSNWLVDLSNLRDPREIPFDDAGALTKYAISSLARGGGFGAFEVLLLQENIMSQRAAESQLGPGTGLVLNSLQAAHHGFNTIFDGSEDRDENFRKFGEEMFKVGKGVTPFQNLWWIRGALHNMFLNDVHEFIAPGYKDRLRGAMQKNYGSEYFMGNDVEPRAPNFGNIAGGQ